jgi:hypothetical protein
MKRKLMLLLLVMTMTVVVHAQFEEGKMYVNTSLTNLDMSYNGINDLKLGVEAKGGYLYRDNLMLLASASFQHVKDTPNQFALGVEGRYYIIQNGLFLGAGAKYVHCSDYNDLLPGVEVGYAFFLSRTVTLEPALYYDQSLKKHSDYSTIGFKIGFGFYL